MKRKRFSQNEGHLWELKKNNQKWMLYFCVHLSNAGRLQSFAAACSSPLWPLRAAEGQQETELRTETSSLQLPQHDALPGAWGGSASHQQWTLSGVFRLCCWPPWEPWNPFCCCDAVATHRLAQKPAWVPGYVCADYKQKIIRKKTSV